MLRLFGDSSSAATEGAAVAEAGVALYGVDWGVDDNVGCAADGICVTVSVGTTETGFRNH